MESFFIRLQGKVMKRGEDKMVWTSSRNGVFLVKSLYSMLELRRSILFPNRHYLESIGLI